MKQESKDCPLCSASKVITYTASSVETVTTPNPRKNIIGNYRRHFVGGGYDTATHAKVCPKLEGVFQKERILQYHLGIIEIMIGDVLSFEDYQKAFNDKGFAIYIDVKRIEEKPLAGKKWAHQIYIKSNWPEHDLRESYLVTTGKNPEDAFAFLKYRLINGEIATVPRRDGSVEYWQMVSSSHPEKLQSITFKKNK